MKKVIVLSDWCLPCWACIAICPNVFKFDENWKSTINKQPENDSDWADVMDAKSSCPVSVIQIED